MSWYNNQSQGFVDSTQILQGGGGGGGGGASQEELDDINDDITQINATLADINAVFIPKQLNTQNGSIDTIIVNNTTNSRIFIKNENETPKIRIEDGKLYLYYDYDFINAPTITAGWIDVDNYITAIKQGVLTLDANVLALDTLIFAPTIGIKPRLEILEPIVAVNTANITDIQGQIIILADGQKINMEDWLPPKGRLYNHLKENFDSQMKLYREEYGQKADAFLEIIKNADRSGAGEASKTASALFRSKNELFYAYFQNVLLGLGGIALLLQAVGEIYDRVSGRDIEIDEAKHFAMYEKIKDSPSAQIPKHIHKNGLVVVPSTDNGFYTFLTYKVTLSNGAKLRIKTNGPSGNVSIESVEEVGSIFFNVGNIINIPKNQLGETSGTLQIEVTSLISEVEVIVGIINSLDEKRQGINNRRRLRDGIINTDELGDGLTTQYNSSITNEETNEVLQVPTIKLKLNTDQMNFVNGAVNIIKYVNQDDIDVINGNITIQDGEIADINTNLDKVYKILLPTGATISSDYKMNLGYKEIFQGFPTDLIMFAINKNSFTTFNADDFNLDYLGYFPLMNRLAMTGDKKVISQISLQVNTSDQFTKGWIYIKNESEFSVYNLNRKFEFVCFLKFVSFNNNTTDYHIFQSAVDLGTQIDIDYTKLAVWIRNRKLKLQHPANVSYLEYPLNTANVLTTYIVNNNCFEDGVGQDDNVFILAQPTSPSDYKYAFNLRNNPYYPLQNNFTTLLKIINDAYTTEQNQDTTYIAFYLSHPNDPSKAIADCSYPYFEYLIDYTIIPSGIPPTFIKRVTLKFDILFNTQTSSNDQFPQMTQQTYAETVAKCDFTFQIIYSFDGQNQIQHNFTMADVNSTLTTTGTTYYHGWGGAGTQYFPKRFWTYSFDIVGTYPTVGQKVRILNFRLVKKPNAVYQHGTTAQFRYNNQPIMYLFKYIIQDYASTEITKLVVFPSYTTTETSLALSSGILSNKFYLFNLQLDLPNDSIVYFIDGVQYYFTPRTVNKVYPSDIPFPDPTIPFFNVSFVSWANLTQDNSVLAVGNIPSTGAVHYTHFNWRFFQNTEQFYTVAEMNKLKELIVFNYYYDYVSVDKLLDTNEISANNISTRQLIINNNPLIAGFTTATRSRDLRSDQTQEAGNVLIPITNLYVENPTSSGNIYYNKNTKVFSVGGGGLGTREDEDAITLGFIEDSAGDFLEWNDTNKTLNVMPELLYPVNDLINTNDQNISNYVWHTSNYLKYVIDNLPSGGTSYDDTNISNYVWHTSNYLQTQINTNDQNVSNYVWHTSNYLQTQINTNDQNVSNYVNITSNILNTDYIARDAILNTSIETNKYTNAKVATYLNDGTNKIITGNVGIGTTNPLSLLELSGAFSTLRIVDGTTSGTPRVDLIRGTGNFGADGLVDWRIENSSSLFRIGRGNVNQTPSYLSVIACNSSGNVGFGTDTPVFKLHNHTTSASTECVLKTTNGTTGSSSTDGFDVGIDNSQNAILRNNENTNIIFLANATERMRILASGDVGIGTTNSPFARLHLHKSATTQDVRIQFTDSTSGATSNDGVIVGKLPDGRGFLFNYENFPLFFGTNGTERMTITSGGDVGIGTTTTSGFKVQIQGALLATGGITTQYLSVNYSGVDLLGVQLFSQVGLLYTATMRIIFNTFTGFHRSYTSDPLFNEEQSDVFKNEYAGRLVIATGKIKTDVSNEDNEWSTLNDKEGITYEDAVPVVELSRQRKDKRIFGVLGLPTRKTNNKNRLIINSVGEGAIWVANSNGNIENGDYIQSSNEIGYGEKQDDDILHNYTVAKATMDCDFNLMSPYYQCFELPNGVRVAFIACTYHSG